MSNRRPGLDPLFRQAETLAREFSLFPNSPDVAVRQPLPGLLRPAQVRARVRRLRGLDADAYIRATIRPAEDKARPGARAVLRELPVQIVSETQSGPLYAAEIDLDLGTRRQRVGVLAQERTNNNGVWTPREHTAAVGILRHFTAYAYPVVTLIDTPGADAGAAANANNQAHTISRLIAEVMQLDVPLVSVILGNGYSGGAIPLAAGNILLSLRDGVYNTIQPPGLASIARKYNLSWQDCARYVGVSPCELQVQGNIDGIIDYVPGERGKITNLLRAISAGIVAVEDLATHFVATNDDVFEHYARSVRRFVAPSATLAPLQEAAGLSLAQSPTRHPNVFGVAYRYLRYLGLRRRLKFTVRGTYARLSRTELPRGDLATRRRREHRRAFEKWLARPLELRYDETLRRAWRRFSDARDALGHQRGRVASFFLGTRTHAYTRAMQDLNSGCSFHLYNLWKGGAAHNFAALADWLAGAPAGTAANTADAPLSVLSVITDPDVRDSFLRECENLVVFDCLYNTLISELTTVAGEVKTDNVISRESVGRLLETSLAKAMAEFASIRHGGEAPAETAAALRDRFHAWLQHIAAHHRRGAMLKAVAGWKKDVFPRVSEPLFAIVTFYFEHLLPSYFRSEHGHRRFDGRIQPRNIGVKDFWNRLDIAYRDLLISDLLRDVKRKQRILPTTIFDAFFTDVRELDADLMSRDPVAFPGFRISIEHALDHGIIPCGAVTATATFRYRNLRRRVGVLCSNLAFQAGAFDMAGAEKFCRLLLVCASRRIPVVGFLSSGGMQTKEGAGALASMAIINDRITRFVRDTELPVIMFGFGDCTGGVQASLVTHPLVHTYYFSGANIPFAGQIVVPSHLPLSCTLANDLSTVPGAMQGLVRHPFHGSLDKELRRLDPQIPLGTETVQQVVARIITGDGQLDEQPDTAPEPPVPATADLVRPIQRLLIHARGCTAVKLVRVAQARKLPVVLVQSDADMDSVAARMLGRRDTLVCLGGDTPDESYLNAHSVIRVAERERADALHPGIGFLSENAGFADLCRRHGINVVGPPVASMERMGNKANAIRTAEDLSVPVTPGSHGIVTSPEAAAEVAADVGFPVLVKAVHGGGGKGIQRVDRPEDLRAAFLQIAAEARSAFGNGDLYIEKLIETFRHVEIQILRDIHGNVRVLGLRDCSIQRNNQKVIEESGSTALPDDLREEAFKHAAALADKIGYVGAGTVEFIFDLNAGKLCFMEMNTRLQVEHPVTEMVTGIDIVGRQLDIAGGASIGDLAVRPHGYAVEARVNAERAVVDADGALLFLPDPGTIAICKLPPRQGTQVIATVNDGQAVPPYYDSMIAQIICYGADRSDAINRLRDYLDSVQLTGVSTNLPLLRTILDDDVFRKGDYDNRFLAGLLDRIDVAALVAAMAAASGRPAMAADRGAIEVADSAELKVLAPSDGVFYLRPSPDEADFVAEGDVIAADQSLCMLEAMKLFRAISLSSFNQEAPLYPEDCRYRMQRINQANGQAVSRGDLLFIVEPLPVTADADRETPDRSKDAATT